MISFLGKGVELLISQVLEGNSPPVYKVTY